jgi:hypothetical protein
VPVLKLSRLVLLGILLSSCNSKKQSNSETITFQSIYDSLEKIELPLQLTPKSWSEIVRTKTKNHSSLSTAHTQPIAKIYDCKDFKLVLFEFQAESAAPILYSVNKKNELTDTLFLMGDWTSNDPENRTQEYVTINKDLTIQLLDSAFTWKVDSLGERIQSTMATKVKLENYQISEMGKILKGRESISNPIQKP